MATTAADLARWKRRRNLITWILIGILVVSLLFVYFFYKPWRLGRLDRAARGAMNQGDFGGASFNARRALQLDPNHESACLVMAELAERLQDPVAVLWRERITHLTGGSAASLIAYASAAITFGRLPLAKQALDQVSQLDRQTADFQSAAGRVAFDSGDFASAETFFSKAAELDPANASHRFALARAQVGNQDFFKKESGRKLLSDLANVDTHRLLALRELVMDYAATGELQAALREARKLTACSDRASSDDINFLQLLRKTNDGGFASALATVKQTAGKNSKDAAALLLWMSSAGLASDGLNWVLKEAPEIGRMMDVKPALAGCYLMLGDWSKLLSATATASGTWQRAEYIRRAYRTRASRALNLEINADTEWAAAISDAVNDPTALAWLARMATEWGWQAEEETTWWAVLARSPKETWALEKLYQRYMTKKNTAGIRQVLTHILTVDPENESAQNDFAMSSLLLDREVDRAREIAISLYKKYPDNAAYASTYAFSLLTEGRQTDALQIFDALPAAELESPEVAAYYGMVLVANDAPEKARRFLDIARGANLLPEEQAWIAGAAGRIPEKKSSNP